MHALEHAMARLIDMRSLLLRITAPQHEHQVLALPIEDLDDARGEAFPAAIGVGAGLALGHREHRIEQQHALLGPALDRKSTRLNSSHVRISYAVFCLKKKTTTPPTGDAHA